MTRQLSREPLDLDPLCLQKMFKAAARAYGTSSTCFISTCIWSDISYLLKQTESTKTRQLSREQLDLDRFCLQNILKPPNAHMAQVQLVYDQIFHIPISKPSGPWPGSSHESRQIWIHFVYRNVLEPPHEHIAKVPLVSYPLMYDQIFHIPISKQSRPYSGSSQESCLIWIYFVYKESRPWSGSSHESRLIRIYFVYKNV